MRFYIQATRRRGCQYCTLFQDKVAKALKSKTAIRRPQENEEREKRIRRKLQKRLEVEYSTLAIKEIVCVCVLLDLCSYRDYSSLRKGSKAFYVLNVAMHTLLLNPAQRLSYVKRKQIKNGKLKMAIFASTRVVTNAAVVLQALFSSLRYN